MRRTVLAVILAAATLVALVTTPAHGQSTQTARGTVTAMSGNTVTIVSGDRSMSFAIDRQTVVTATGAGTATRAAAAAGKSGPKFSELIKVGDAIEVVYRDRGGKLMAASVRRMRAPVETSAGAGKQKDVDQRHGRIGDGERADDHGRVGRRLDVPADVHDRQGDQGRRARRRHGVAGRQGDGGRPGVGGRSRQRFLSPQPANRSTRPRSASRRSCSSRGRAFQPAFHAGTVGRRGPDRGA